MVGYGLVGGGQSCAGEWWWLSGWSAVRQVPKCPSAQMVGSGLLKCLERSGSDERVAEQGSAGTGAGTTECGGGDYSRNRAMMMLMLMMSK